MPNENTSTAVSRETWLEARRKLLVREKAVTRQLDELAAARRALPWVRIEENYVFESMDGPRTLGDLFGPCSQLFIYHFMLGPDWEQGCKSCSFVMDHLTGAALHLPYNDLAFAAVSRSPVASIEAFRKRMGWDITWVSSLNNRFNFDYHVSFTPDEVQNGGGVYNFGTTGPGLPFEELPGASVFVKNAVGEIFHTYSAYSRGLDILLGAHQMFDFTPKGRNEREDEPMDWIRHHDRYEQLAH